MRFLAFFSALMLFFIVLPLNARADVPLAVNSLRIGTHDSSTRIVVELSHRADFRAFMLQNPTRLVIDLPAFEWRASLPSSQTGSLVGAIRNGLLQPGISRIVIDLNKPSSLKSAFFLPSGPQVSDRVVMDVSPISSPVAAPNDKMFGSLNTPPPKFGQNPPETPTPKSFAAPKSFSAPADEPKKETNALQTPAAYVAPEKPPVFKGGSKPMIVIDAGHGGEDPGAIGAGGRKEKEVTLAAAKELASQLEATGRYRVHLTRSTDVFIKLQERVAISRKHNADLFISLHADSIDKPGVSGASIYTLSNKASDAQTAKLAARENQADLIAGVDLSHEDKEVANILIDLAMRDTMNQSKYFANTVVKQASGTGIRMLEKPHRFAGFAVLKAPDVPSVLIEMGFMSNAKEVSQLSSPDYRKKMAGAIVRGIDGYFSKVQKTAQK